MSKEKNRGPSDLLIGETYNGPYTAQDGKVISGQVIKRTGEKEQSMTLIGPVLIVTEYIDDRISAAHDVADALNKAWGLPNIKPCDETA